MRIVILSGHDTEVVKVYF